MGLLIGSLVSSITYWRYHHIISMVTYKYSLLIDLRRIAKFVRKTCLLQIDIVLPT